jgi:hypothetical protein
MQKPKIHIIPLDQLYEFDSDEDRETFRKVMSAQYGFPYIPPPNTPAPDTPAQKPKAGILWLPEAITYLGLDRLGIKRPDKAIHRLINKGALRPKKISGRLCFDISELNTVLANGDQKRGRGRPRK